MALYLGKVHPCAYEHPVTGTGSCGQARAASARPLPLVPLSPRCSWRLVWGKQPVATADSSPSLLPWLLRGAPLCPGQHPAAQVLPGMPFISSRERTFSLLRRRGEFAFRVGKQEAAGFQLEWTKEWTKPVSCTARFAHWPRAWREHGRTSLADEEARRAGEGCALISLNKAGGKSPGPWETRGGLLMPR